MEHGTSRRNIKSNDGSTVRSDRRCPGRLAFLISSLVFLLNLFPSTTCFAGNRIGQPGQAGGVEKEDSFQVALRALKEGRIEAALYALTNAEREHPDDARVRNFRGVVLARLVRDREAAEEYLEAIRLDAQMEDAYRNLGYLYWTEHRLADARRSLDQALNLNPADSFAHYYLGRVELDERRYEQAFLQLKRSGVELPRDPAFVFAAVTGFINIDDSENARAMLGRLDLPSLSPTQSVQASAFFAGLQKTDKALDLLGSLGGATATSPPQWLRFDRALVHLLAGKDQAAIEQAALLVEPPSLHSPPDDNSVSAQDGTASAWSLLGIAHAHCGNSRAAVDALRRATSLAPQKEEHWLNLTRELMELSQYPDAIAATHDALAANPDSYALHLRLGAADLAAGRYTEAEAVFRDLVAAGDPLPTSYVGLAQVLLRTDRASDAVAELAAAQERLGPNFLISYFLGLSLNRVSRRPEAAAAFREALRLNPKSAEAHSGLGKTELVLGHLTEAIAQLEEALHLSPGDLLTRRLLTQARFRLANNTGAIASTKLDAEPAADSQAGELGDFFVPEWQFPQPTAP